MKSRSTQPIEPSRANPEHPGTNTDLETRRQLAATRLALARARVKVIRRRVAVGTASVFTAAWLGVFGQLISGQDPALGDGTKSATARASTTSTVHRTSASARTGSGNSSSSVSGSSSSSHASSTSRAQQTVAATPMTTRAS